MRIATQLWSPSLSAWNSPTYTTLSGPQRHDAGRSPTDGPTGSRSRTRTAPVTAPGRRARTVVSATVPSVPKAPHFLASPTVTTCTTAGTRAHHGAAVIGYTTQVRCYSTAGTAPGHPLPRCIDVLLQPPGTDRLRHLPGARAGQERHGRQRVVHRQHHQEVALYPAATRARHWIGSPGEQSCRVPNPAGPSSASPSRPRSGLPPAGPGRSWSSGAASSAPRSPTTWPPRGHRRARARARPAHLGHHVARRRPDDLLRLHERDQHPLRLYSRDLYARLEQRPGSRPGSSGSA